MDFQGQFLFNFEGGKMFPQYLALNLLTDKDFTPKIDFE